jgi:AbrB family looped-hinge helix DNA binding protein
MLFSAIKVEKHQFSVSGMTVEKAEFTVYVRKDGKMTVPKGVRDALGIEEGNLVKCEIKKVETS